MKFQTVYETNADYLESWKKLRTDSRVEKLCQSSRGHLKFRFKGTDLFVELVEATGKLVICWHDEKIKKIYFPQLVEVLATKDGSPLEINPLHANIYRVPIPPPNNFSLLWCKKAFRYVLEKMDLWPFIVIMIITFAAFGTCQIALDLYALNQTGEAMKYVAKMHWVFSYFLVIFPIIAIFCFALFKFRTKWQFMKKNRSI